MSLEEFHLLLGEDVGGVLGVGLQAHQPLVSGLQVVSQPDPAHAGGANVDLSEPKFIGDALGAVGGVIEAQRENLFLDFHRDPVGVGVPRASFLFDQGADAADLEGAADLVESVSVIAHDLAGRGHVAEFLGQLQQGELAFGTL